jgi:acyl-CoA dehydrogenase
MQFGTPIVGFQAVSHMIAEMATEIEAGRRLAYHAASLMEAGIKCNKEASMAKYWCAEMLLRVVDKAVQIHGGYGYIREYRVERLYRDAKLQTIGGGTNQIMRTVIASEMGLRVK